MPTVTVRSHGLTKKVAYEVPVLRDTVRFGVCTDSWNEAVARVGPMASARLYCGPGEDIGKHRQFVLDHPEVHVVISYLSRGLNRTAHIDQLSAWPLTSAGTTVVPNHEPFGKKAIPPPEFVQSVLDAADDHRAGGSPRHVRRGAILDGWMESVQPWAVKKMTGLGGYDNCLPSVARNNLDVVGWDLYDDADYPNYGKGIGPGYKLVSAAARAQTWAKPFLVGEAGSFDPVSQQDFFDRLVALAHPPTDVCWWDHASTHSLLEGDLRTWFLAAQAALS